MFEPARGLACESSPPPARCSRCPPPVGWRGSLSGRGVAQRDGPSEAGLGTKFSAAKCGLGTFVPKRGSARAGGGGAPDTRSRATGATAGSVGGEARHSWGPQRPPGPSPVGPNYGGAGEAARRRRRSERILSVKYQFWGSFAHTRSPRTAPQIAGVTVLGKGS